MSRGYQKRDAHFIDYELYELQGVHGTFRGPPVQSREYIACVGASQTFGRFVQMPFPRLISYALRIDTLNLGRGGAGPEFPLENPALMEHINGSRIVIVQVFSGRSQSNSLFRMAGQTMCGTNLANGSECSADQFYTWLLTQDTKLAQEIVAETREKYASAMTRLLDAIVPPTILFWFSTRSPDYEECMELPLTRLFGEFPQLINRAIVERLKGHTSLYVECISKRGLPQLVPGQHSGASAQDSSSTSQKRIVTRNLYYPSPEMHEDAAAALIPACQMLLDQRSA
jgi:hypothetical protein